MNHRHVTRLNIFRIDKLLYKLMSQYARKSHKKSESSTSIRYKISKPCHKMMMKIRFLPSVFTVLIFCCRLFSCSHDND